MTQTNGKTEWTKGPWSVSFTRKVGRVLSRNAINGAQIRDATGLHIASVTSVADKHINQKEADAHLIAAAPDLYEALIGVVAVADRRTVEFDAARAALSKARGEP